MNNKKKDLIIGLALGLTLVLGMSLLMGAGTSINGGRTHQSTINFCADAGMSDTYACDMSPALAAYVSGACYTFKANTANTGAATINFNSIAAKTIVKVAGGITTALADNDIRAGQYVNICYDGTNMQMQSILGNAPSAGLTVGTTTVSGGTSPYILYNNSGVLGNVQVVPGANGGGLVWLQTCSPSAVAECDFTAISGTYDTYQLDVTNVNCATTSRILTLQAGTGGGPTYDTGTNYSHDTWGFRTSGGGGNGGTSKNNMPLISNAEVTTSNWSINGEFKIYNPAGAIFKQVIGSSAGIDGTGRIGFNMTGVHEVTTAWTAFRVFCAAGDTTTAPADNIASGTIRLYGLAKL
jgi:hypothetical protein